MPWRVIVVPHDGRGARNLRLGSGRFVLVVTLVASMLMSALWLGWKLGELIAG